MTYSGRVNSAFTMPNSRHSKLHTQSFEDDAVQLLRADCGGARLALKHPSLENKGMKNVRD